MDLAQIPSSIRDFFLSYGLLGKIALYVPLGICTLFLIVSI